MDIHELKKALTSAAADVKVRMQDGLSHEKQSKHLAALRQKMASYTNPDHVRSLSNSIGKLTKR